MLIGKLQKYGLLIGLMMLCHTVAFGIQGVAGTAVFYNPKPTLHLYWQLNPTTVSYQRLQDTLVNATFITEVSFTNAEFGTYFTTNFKTKTTAVKVQDLNTMVIFEQQTFPIQAGKSYIKLKMYQEGKEGEAFNYKDSVIVIDLQKQNGAWLSGLQLIDTSFASKDSISQYYGGGRIKVPRPLSFFDEGVNNLKYYAELYNTADIDTSLFPIYIKSALVKSSDGRMSTVAIKTDTLNKGKAFLPIWGNLNMETQASGNYNVVLWFTDARGKELGRSQHFIQTINTTPVALEVPAEDTAAKANDGKLEYLDLAKTFVAKYNNDQIRSMLQMILPVSNGGQKNTIEGFLKKPEPIYSRYFIYNFFQAMDPQKPERAWQEYAQKVKDVNRLFGNRGGVAFNSDRGYTYLKYGEPTERIVVRNESNAVPYEIWSYNYLPEVGGTGLFLFYQAGKLSNDIRLLHSNVIGEIRNAAWRVFLYPNGGDNQTTGRAAQYFQTY